MIYDCDLDNFAFLGVGALDSEERVESEKEESILVVLFFLDLCFLSEVISVEDTTSISAVVVVVVVEEGVVVDVGVWMEVLSEEISSSLSSTETEESSASVIATSLEDVIVNVDCNCNCAHKNINVN